jgi:hypothetical protein
MQDRPPEYIFIDCDAGLTVHENFKVFIVPGGAGIRRQRRCHADQSRRVSEIQRQPQRSGHEPPQQLAA